MKYSEEFKQDAVALVRAGATQREVCRDLGISKSAMSKWVADADRRDVDRERRRLYIEENAVMVGGHIEIGTPKTHENRSVPYPRFLDAEIQQMSEGKQRDMLLLSDGRLHMRLPNSYRGWFRGAVDRLQAADRKRIEDAAERGVKLDLEVFPTLTPHDLRHTAASLAISAARQCESCSADARTCVCFDDVGHVRRPL